jgi:subtilisin family serine protease
MVKKSFLCLVFVSVLVSFVAFYLPMTYSGEPSGSGQGISALLSGSPTPGSLMPQKSPIEPLPNDGIPIKKTEPSPAGTKPPQADVTKKAPSPGQPSTTSVSQLLGSLSQEQRENSLIELEATRDIAATYEREIKNAQSLWNSGQFDSAIENIRVFEESGKSLAVGISWKTPIKEISANWATEDTRIGSKTNVDKTCLDYDAQSGNLFAVLRYTSTNWYWSVNISTDKGKTWQETYEWYATYLIRDVSAAVVGNYLWVGYLGGDTAYHEGRIRRFSVSAGAEDTSYGYHTIIDKGVPITEISVSANADSFDNRVYFSAILDTSSGSSPSNTTEVSQSLTDEAQQETGNQVLIQTGDPTATLRQLADNSKLHFPDRVLKAFNNGEKTTRVIVNLRNPNPSPTRAVTGNFGDPSVRSAVAKQVTTAQDNVINALDKNEVRITNRFTYIFGFSAEVTLAGLASLVNNPNVVSIDEDKIVEPHLAQGIPLMNATAARSSHNGAGLAIAICDTGINYNHPMLGNGSFPNSKVIGGYDTGQNDSDPMDGNGHGTACAGIAAGNLGSVGDYIGGVAYGAKLYALKMTYTSTNGSAYTADMVEAWEWVITHQNDDPNNPIMIISTSFGGGHYTSQSACNADTPAMTTAAANAKAAGITIFVSTGNDGYCDGTGWPGCLSDVNGVGAVYDAAFGTYYPCISGDSCAPTKTPTAGCTSGYYATDNTAADLVTSYSNSSSFMSLFAPSNQAYTLGLGTGYNTTFGGTSAACPYAAGAAAVLQSTAKAVTGSYLTPDQVKSTLTSTGDSITDPKVAVTKPRVNLGNAVASLAQDNLVFFWADGVDTATPVWYEIATDVTDAMEGLASSYNTNFTTAYVMFVSYISSETNHPVKVLRLTNSTHDTVQTNSNYTGWGGTTSISAYTDTVFCAYEYYTANGYGIRYDITYDGGDSWNLGTFDPDPGHSYLNPDVTARGGQGSAVVFSDEVGEPDNVWFYYRNHYTPGPWDSEITKINGYDDYTGTPNTINWLPPMPGKTYSYGIIYISSVPSYGTPYFDRSDASTGMFYFIPNRKGGGAVIYVE